MGLQLNKDEYTFLIEGDLEFLNKHCPDGDMLDHIKMVLCNSIDMHYPSESQKPETSDEALPIADVGGFVSDDMLGFAEHCRLTDTLPTYNALYKWKQ